MRLHMHMRNLLCALQTAICAAAIATIATAAPITTPFDITITPANGGRPSFFPPGHTWTLALDSQFNASTLDTSVWSNWYTPGSVRSANGGMLEDNTRALFFTGGNMEIRTFPATGSGYYFGTGGIITNSSYGPGYYVSRMKAGTGWATFWSEGFLKNSNGSCGSLSGPAGFEADILETQQPNIPNGQNNVHWGGYDSCHQSSGVAVSADPNTFHEVGFLWEPTGLTFYLDGHQTFFLAGPISTTPQQIIFSVENPETVAGNYLDVDWFQYYTGSP